MKTLSQKLRSAHNTFTIVDDGVMVERKLRKSKDAYKIEFHGVFDKEYTQIKGIDTLTVLFFFSAFFNVFLINIAVISVYPSLETYGGIIFMVLLVGFVVSMSVFKDHFVRVNVKTLEAEQSLQFFYTKKMSEETDRFIASIKEHQKQYYRKRFFKVDPIIPFETQRDRYLWLYQNKYITGNEYAVVKEELESQKIIKESI